MRYPVFSWKRCHFCKGILWPWQRQPRTAWHYRCWLAARNALIRDAAWERHQAELRWKEEDQL